MEQLATESHELCADFLNNLPINNWDELIELSWNQEFIRNFDKLSEIFRWLIDTVIQKHEWIWRRLENLFAETWNIIINGWYLDEIPQFMIDALNRNVRTILNLLSNWSEIIINQLSWIIPNARDPINIRHELFVKPIFEVFWPQDAHTATSIN